MEPEIEMGIAKPVKSPFPVPKLVPIPPMRTPKRSAYGMLGYPLMIASTIALFLLIRSTGASIAAPAQTVHDADPAAVPASANLLLHVLLALVVVIIAARVSAPFASAST